MFIIKYRQNPIHFHNQNSSQINRAKKYITKSLHNINYKITCMRMHRHNKLNVDKNYRRVIRGLALLYGFKPLSFMHSNFYIKSHTTFLKRHQRPLTIQTWLSVIQELKHQLDTIHDAKDLQHIQDKYHGYVYVNGIKSSHRYKIANHARKELAKLGNGQRYRFIGQYARFGKKSNGQLSLLLKHITYHGKEVTGHLWFSYTQGFRKLGHLKKHQLISFEARVKRYHKGYVPLDFTKHYDYKLSYPSKIAKV